MNHASGIISDSLSFSSHSPAGSGVHAGTRTRPSLRARVRICEAGRELNGRHSTIVKWHFSLHCTYSTYLPNPGALPPTHPPAQVRQQRINSKPVSEIGSCSIGKQSRSGHVTSRVAPSGEVPRCRWPLRLSFAMTGYPGLTSPRRQPKPSPRILAQMRVSVLLLILLPLLAGLAGWLAFNP